ncbi:hypothetical protein yfred0001_26430 [Yersinia frederiksenii ATCC 33641]|nr:hypothetical protein yfred0001_26430 [Yersinia frederiksenii ATCC 33641]
MGALECMFGGLYRLQFIFLSSSCPYFIPHFYTDKYYV